MEKLLNWLERRFQHLAIPNIGILVIAPKILFLFVWMAQGQPRSLEIQSWFLPALVLDGEWIRMFTFVAVPPTKSPIFFFFYAYVTWLFCKGLEQQWGAFRLNVYLLISWLATVVAGFLVELLPGEPVIWKTAFVNEQTILFAFAVLYPNFTLNLFFVLPVKVKYLSIIGWIWLGFQFWNMENWPSRIVLVCVVANYLLFFGEHHIRFLRDRASARIRRKRWEDAMKR